MTIVLRLTSVGILLVAASSQASAQSPWLRLGSGNELRADVDTTSLRRAPDGSVVARVREFRGGNIGRIPSTYAVELTQFDCRGGRSRILEIRDDAAGIEPPRRGTEAPDTARWVRYSDGSVGAQIHAAVCRVAGSLRTGPTG